jgi:CubicO group peptidase (beta-lactamase class C family)
LAADGRRADGSWIIDKGDYEAAYCCPNATPRDYARLGMLLANDGALGGRQIIPAAWVRAATTPPGQPVEPGNTLTILGCGYQTWIVPGKVRQFMLRGLRGQAVFVDPESKLVLVHAAAADVGGEPTPGSLLALWWGVVESLGGGP